MTATLLEKQNLIVVATGNSGNTGEKISSMSLNNTEVVLFSLPLPSDLQVGDIIEAWGDSEITNPNAFNCFIAGRIMQTQSDTANTGFELGEANGGNITPGNHHWPLKCYGWIVVTDTSYNHLNMLANTLTATGSDLVVEQDYGRLFYNVYREQYKSWAEFSIDTIVTI